MIEWALNTKWTTIISNVWQDKASLLKGFPINTDRALRRTWRLWVDHNKIFQLPKWVQPRWLSLFQIIMKTGKRVTELRDFYVLFPPVVFNSTAQFWGCINQAEKWFLCVIMSLQKVSCCCRKPSRYRSGTVNSKSFVGKILLWIKWKFELTYAL